VSRAAVRAEPAVRPSVLDVFIARAEARALLWHAGELSLHDAVDGLQADAERNGLVANIGQDNIQGVMAAAFGALRDDLTPTASDAVCEKPTPESDVFHDPDDEGSIFFSTAARAAVDERQRNKPPGRTIETARGLMAEEVSLERAWFEMSKPNGIAASIIMAAEYLVLQGNVERLRNWLGKHTIKDRTAITRHFEGKHHADPQGA
jgi:hypothetical protein